MTEHATANVADQETPGQTKTLARTLSLVSLAISVLTALRLRSTHWCASTLHYGAKLMGGALSPLTAALGGLGAILGIRTRAPLATVSGALGAALSARYLRGVTAPHDGLARAFGPDWPDRIPPERRARMRRWRGLPFPLSFSRVRWTRDVAYATVPGTSRRLLCDVWQPPESIAPTGLGLIYLHGGAWQSFDKDRFTRPFFRHLAGQGHVAMDVSYRMCPETDMYGIVADVKRAIAWLKAQAARYGVDPARVVVAGGSAGGHLALLAAYTPHHPALDPPDLGGADTAVRAVVSYYGLPDLRRRGIAATEPTRNPLIPLGRKLGLLAHDEYFPPDELARRLFGGTPAEVPQVAALMSPLTHVGPHCPPTLLLQGLHDHITSVEDVQALRRALEDAGVPVVYVPLPAVEHAFDLCLPRVSPPAQVALYDLERFLAVV